MKKKTTPTPMKFFLGKFKTGSTLRVLRERVKVGRLMNTKVVEEVCTAGYRLPKAPYTRVAGTYASREKARQAKYALQGRLNRRGTFKRVK